MVFLPFASFDMDQHTLSVNIMYTQMQKFNLFFSILGFFQWKVMAGF